MMRLSQEGDRGGIRGRRDVLIGRIIVLFQRVNMIMYKYSVISEDDIKENTVVVEGVDVEEDIF